MTGQHADTPADDLACRELVEITTEYLEGTLPAAEVRRLERHVDTCEGCGEYLAQMRTIAGSLAGLAEDSVPAEMRDGLISAFRGFRHG